MVRCTDFEYLVVLDFEATCDEPQPIVPREVIEFPSVLLRTSDWAVVDEFEAFVRPVHNPKLTRFCTELTAITQADVDGALTFGAVFARYMEWLRRHKLVGLDSSGPPSSMVMCGDWDLQTMLPEQCRIATPPIDWIPRPFRSWVNIKRTFAAWSGRRAPGLPGMLRALDLELTGHHHRGIDDCRNIAKVVRALAAKGCRIETTTELIATRHPPIRVVLDLAGDQRELFLEKRLRAPLLGQAGGLFRTAITRVFDPAGKELLHDGDLADLREGSVLRIEPSLRPER